GIGERRGSAFHQADRFWSAPQRDQHAGRAGRLTLTILLTNVRFCGRYWGKSGHALLHCKCLLLTQSGHGPALHTSAYHQKRTSSPTAGFLWNFDWTTLQLDLLHLMPTITRGLANARPPSSVRQG